jgi:hypothetical protein
MRLICPMPPRTKRWRSRWEDVHLSLDSGYLERRPIRGARLERDQARRSAKALIWWSLHDARSTANVFQICTEEMRVQRGQPFPT